MKQQKLVGLLATLCLIVISISGCMDLQPSGLQALFTATESEHVIPFTASFDGTLTYNASGEAISYLWTFGDGGSDTGPVVDHVYQQDGVYVVTLTVFDAEGQMASTSMSIQALNPLPTAEFTYSPKSTMEEILVVSASEWVTFDGSQSADDGEVVAYEWYFGRDLEGNILEDKGQIVKHRWLYAGTYSVILTVTDNDGDSSTCVQEVEVLGGEPCYTDITGDIPWSQ